MDTNTQPMQRSPSTLSVLPPADRRGIYFTWATCLCFRGMFFMWSVLTQTIFLAGERDGYLRGLFHCKPCSVQCCKLEKSLCSESPHCKKEKKRGYVSPAALTQHHPWSHTDLCPSPHTAPLFWGSHPALGSRRMWICCGTH